MQNARKTEPPNRVPVDGIQTLRDMDWRTLIPIAICAAILVWLYTPTFLWWYNNWMLKESYYSHGLLVPLVSGAIIWMRREQLSSIPVRGFAAGFLFLIPLLLCVVVISWAGPSSPLGLSFPFVLAGMILVLFGPALLKDLRFPLGYLFFMCVLPGFLLVKASFRIQMLSTIVSTVMLRMVGLHAVREGAAITLPSVEVLVGAPCSGFRLLISMFALAVLFVYLIDGPRWGKFTLLVLTLPLSVVLNSFRITLIALVGQFFGTNAMHGFHDWSGYIMLVLSLLVLWLLARMLKCRELKLTLTS